MDAYRRLIGDNLTVLRQGLEVIQSLDEHMYSRAVPEVRSSGIGSHFRHTVDYWRCLLRDRESGSVDFDRRERSRRLETDPIEAAGAVSELLGAVEALVHEDPEAAVVIRMDSVDVDGVVPRSSSTLGREVHGLLSHTIHHFAIVAMLMRMDGREVPEGFGVAPSTLRFWKDTRPSASADS